MYSPASRDGNQNVMPHSNRAWINDSIHSPGHIDRIRYELKHLGATYFELASSESRHLPALIHPDEHIGGILYGYHSGSFALLAATTARIIFLNKRFLFSTEDEISYHAVGGVSLTRAGFGQTVTLHTHIHDYPFRITNSVCAKSFIDYIERRCLERNDGSGGIA